jgi:hypothetical protein
VTYPTDASGYNLPAAAYILNTETNEFVGTLFSSAPEGMVLTNADGSAAFPASGEAVWMLLSCMNPGSIPNCSDQTGAGHLVGFTFPSGAVISNVVVASDAGNAAGETLAFPR